MSLLESVVSELASGDLKIVDLTETLREDYPAISLPPEFEQAWAFKKEVISQYDEKGPMWFWHNISVSEHTGTHFDAPIHWVSGKDLPNNTVDTIPLEDFIAPACVVDCTAEVTSDRDFLLTKRFFVQMGREIRPDSLPKLAFHALRLAKNSGSREFRQYSRGWSSSSGSGWRMCQMDDRGVM